MEAVIRKWGNSPALRLPSAAWKEAGCQGIGQKTHSGAGEKTPFDRSQTPVRPWSRLCWQLSG
ncbi:MAG: hypothetical protein O3A91_06320 [Proteobacteria bacterium]|nr:hypothetical protein [Pseudomonadota bacterium]